MGIQRVETTWLSLENVLFLFQQDLSQVVNVYCEIMRKYCEILQKNVCHLKFEIMLQKHSFFSPPIIFSASKFL